MRETGKLPRRILERAGRLASMRAAPWWVLMLWILSLAAACASSSTSPSTKRRQYKPPVTYPQTAVQPREGSLFTAQSPGVSFFVDPRAHQVGDIVTIIIDEKSSATGTADTELGRESGVDAGISHLLGLMEYAGSEIDALDQAKLLEAAYKSEFKGEGKTKRSGTLSATVTATVMGVLPNGNLFIEGYKILVVNNEDWYYYVSGVIRPIDIMDDNSVESSLIAELQVEFTGRGDLSDMQERGWFQEVLDDVWPF